MISVVESNDALIPAGSGPFTENWAPKSPPRGRDRRREEKEAEAVGNADVGVTYPYRRTARYVLRREVKSQVGRVVGIEIDLRPEDEGAYRNAAKKTGVRPVGRVADRGEQFGLRSRAGAVVGRIVERDRDRGEARRKTPGDRRGGGAGRVAGEGLIAIGQVDGVEEGRVGRVALIGDDLVARAIEIEAGQRDRGSRRDQGRRRIRDRAFAGEESAGSQPAVAVKLMVVPAWMSRSATNVNASGPLLAYWTIATSPGDRIWPKVLVAPAEPTPMPVVTF
jgi:hypothetical protein